MNKGLAQALTILVSMLLLILLLCCTGDAFFNRERSRIRFGLEQVKVKDSTVASGVFVGFIGTYHMENQLYFRFYVRRNDGAIKAVTVRDNYVTIYQNAKSAKQAWAICRPCTYAHVKQIQVWEELDMGDWELHIPAGSISNNFDLDL